MNKLKLKRVIAKPNNTSICIYYSKDGIEMMFPTGISISSERILATEAPTDPPPKTMIFFISFTRLFSRVHSTPY